MCQRLFSCSRQERRKLSETELWREIGEVCPLNLPTLSTPYLWPATWCDSGTHPFRWPWPCGPRGRWPHISVAGSPPESRGVRFTPRPEAGADPGVSSSLPRAREDSIITLCWVVDICIDKKIQKAYVQHEKIDETVSIHMLLLRKYRIQPRTQIQQTVWAWGWQGFMEMVQSRRNRHKLGSVRCFRSPMTSTVTDSNSVVTPAVSGGEAGLQKQRWFNDFHILNSSINTPLPHPTS